ncbi:response regulator [Methanoculleus sp. FWC-SCC1]|uniref:Response regulator n=1 Tax=Methanoculleus frigidifontis TaxID=2584085 RepID=A0ABT8M7H8_9EURY|nr:response regulator [Methanoculleus sp. FWC-SCC1]MDN7023888.1 response regulator [Methanoculleus sp. FWC-SCC1]
MTGRQVAIVEDNAIIALDIGKRLEKLGHSVAGVAATAADALRIVEETEPDLVLMDIRLKGEEDGIAAAEAIRSRFNTPIIFITAHSDQSVVERAQGTNPSGYLVKPIRMEDFTTAIGDIFARKE